MNKENDFKINLISSNFDDGKELLNQLEKKIDENWKWIYDLSKPFKKQVEIIFKNFLDYKTKAIFNNITNECLVVICDETEAKIILNKFNEEIKKKDYMPLTLFLYKKKFNINFADYPEIDPRIIYFEKLSNIENFKEIKLSQMLKNIYNKCGDKLQIGTNRYLFNYDLIDNSFSFHLNILCIDKYHQGKSTCLNYIIGKLKTRETESGVSQTKKINTYEVNPYPIKIYDFPGFEDEKSINFVVNKMKEFNEEIRRLMDRVHIILYILNSKEIERFLDKEFLIFEELINHKEAKVIYVFTHCDESLISNEKEEDKKNEKEKMIRNTNESKDSIIKKYLEGLEKEKKNKDEIISLKNEISKKMEINDKNTVFVNFPNKGINNLFKKINHFFQETDSYKKRYEQKEKAEELKTRALNELQCY